MGEFFLKDMNRTLTCTIAFRQGQSLTRQVQINPSSTSGINSWRALSSGNSSVPPNGDANLFTEATTYYYIETEPNKSL